MRNFDVISIDCCPCFIDVISEASRCERACNTTISFSDYVGSRIKFTFAIETFEKEGTLLFCCFHHLAFVFAFDNTYCTCYKKRFFFTCLRDLKKIY